MEMAVLLQASQGKCWSAARASIMGLIASVKVWLLFLGGTA